MFYKEPHSLDDVIVGYCPHRYQAILTGFWLSFSRTTLYYCVENDKGFIFYRSVHI